MKLYCLLISLSTYLHLVQAVPFERPQKRGLSSLVVGTPPGFASGTTGGGDATPVHPKTIAELQNYLTSSSPQVIVIDGMYDFKGSEGTVTVKACNTYKCTPENGGQGLLNTLNTCPKGAKLYDATVDKAALSNKAIEVKSDKTLIGKNSATIYGKGLAFKNGVSNIIVQNVRIKMLNPKYIWGGDAINFAGSSKIWIDHVTTSYVGRQHYVFGKKPNKAITISNSWMYGFTSNSATCDNHHYWGLLALGPSDQITFVRNYVYYMSGRSPDLGETTVFHAVNNVWSFSGKHLLEGQGNKASAIYEGNVFYKTPKIIADDYHGNLIITGDTASCSSSLGRSCVGNAFLSSNKVLLNKGDAAAALKKTGLKLVEVLPLGNIRATVIPKAGNRM